MIGKTVGKFKIISEIGRGGMGVVYKAIQISLNRTVALKMLPTQMALSQEFLERFQREARILARLNHRNIVHIYDLEDLKGSYFIVMEYIEGESLAKIIASQAPLQTAFIKKVAAGVASALSAAHKTGIIHRDIKPENIMMDSYGEVKVMDFGIARAADQTCKTRSGIRLGTPEYMSPEQAKGLRVEAQSDIYSLGIVLYEMACGKVPFTGEDSLGIALKHIQEAPEPPSSLNPRIHPELEKIILKSLEKDRNSRYGDADELHRALDKIAVTEEEEEGALPEKKPLKFIYCPSCGASLQEDFLRCPECGLVVRRQCPYCLEVFDAVYEICPHCSRELPLLKPESAPKTIVDKIPVEEAPAADMRGVKTSPTGARLQPREILRRTPMILAKQRQWFFLGAGFLVVAVFAILILSNGKKAPPQIIDQPGSSTAGSATPQAGTEVPPPQGQLVRVEAPPSLGELQEMLKRAQDYFDRGAYELCIEQSEEILTWRSDQKEAQGLIQRAGEAKPKVALYLSAAKKALQEARYGDCLKECEKILAISSKHVQAQDLLNLAKAQVQTPSVFASTEEKKESSSEDPDVAVIQRIAERQRKAMETENISLLLQDITPELHEGIRRDAEAFFAQNQVLRVAFNNVKIQLLGTEAQVSLTSTISYSPGGIQEARSQSTAATWHLKKMDSDWKITSF
jgi:predicted Ser/Thr protein kinase